MGFNSGFKGLSLLYVCEDVQLSNFCRMFPELRIKCCFFPRLPDFAHSYSG